jgi:hypothetical protein
VTFAALQKGGLFLHGSGGNKPELPRGVEQPSNSSGNDAISRTRDAKSDAAGGGIALDASLRQVIAAWGTLPQSFRRAILAIIEVGS